MYSESSVGIKLMWEPDAQADPRMDLRKSVVWVGSWQTGGGMEQSSCGRLGTFPQRHIFSALGRVWVNNGYVPNGIKLK